MQYDEKYTNELNTLADIAWDASELYFREFKTSAAQVEFLRAQGFSVETNVAHMETAYIASWGEGAPVIAFLGEMDALDGMSQKADATEYSPLPERTTGHGCGHHLLGTGAIAAALYYRDYLAENRLPGTIKLFGCPAEEAGSGKAYLTREGCFAGCDVALTWHPSTVNCVTRQSSQSCINCYFKFHGVSSHAAAAPQLGRSALDAAELMSVGCNYLREHISRDCCLHYAYTNGGGKMPNVVQAEAEVDYYIRSGTNPDCAALFERVCKVARGAAMMTETTVDIVIDEALSNCVLNETLEDACKQAFMTVPAPQYTPEELTYLEPFKGKKLIVADDLPSAEKEKLRRSFAGSPIHAEFLDNPHREGTSHGSTDVGDVSWVLPTVQLETACFAHGSDSHSWQWVAQGRSSTAHKGMLYAGRLLAEVARMLREDPALMAKAKAEFAQRLDGLTYQCLMPAELMPHV